MREVSRREYDGITTYETEIISANALEVEAGTNGYHGGDSGHGSRTYIRIDDICCSDMTVSLTECNFGCKGFQIELRGDCELSTIIDAFKFVVEVLEDQIAEYGNQNE